MFTRTIATIVTTLLICAGLALPARAQFVITSSSPNVGGSVDTYASFDIAGSLAANADYAAFRASLAEMLSYILGAACGVGEGAPLTRDEWDQCGLDDEIGDYDSIGSDDDRDDALTDWGKRKEWEESGLADELGDYDDYANDQERQEAIEELEKKQEEEEDDGSGDDDDDSSGIVGDDQPILGGGLAATVALIDSMLDYHDRMDGYDAQLTQGFGVVFFGF